jgi:hypothetical protein
MNSRFLIHTIVASTAFILVAAVIHAEPALRFKTTTLSLRAKPGETSLSATFEFTNSATQPITITRIETSCGCTKAESDAKVYPPAGDGRLGVTVSPGTTDGTMLRTISIQTDEPDHPTYHLQLNIEVPPILTIEPNYLAWRATDQKPKKLILHSNAAAGIILREVRIPDGLFRATIIATDPVVEIEIVPLGAKPGTTHDLTLEFIADEKPFLRNVLLRILPNAADGDPLPPVKRANAQEGSTNVAGDRSVETRLAQP